MIFLTKQPISYPSYTHKINAILMYINANSTNYNCLAASCFLTDNNYQSAQSFSINFHFYWLKIGKIGNYCQFKHQRCEFVELTLLRCHDKCSLIVCHGKAYKGTKISSNYKENEQK